MAKAKNTKISAKRNELSDLIRRRELIVGVVSLAAVLLLTGAVHFNTSKNQTKEPVKQTSSTFVTPTPASSTKPTLGKEASPVTKLSNTSSDSYAVVLKNDSYWKIAKRVCGNGKIYQYLSDYNDSKPLYEGDYVRIACDF